MYSVRMFGDTTQWSQETRSMTCVISQNGLTGNLIRKNELLFLTIFKPLKTTIFGLNIVKNEVKQPSIYSKSTNI